MATTIRTQALSERHNNNRFGNNSGPGQSVGISTQSSNGNSSNPSVSSGTQFVTVKDGNVNYDEIDRSQVLQQMLDAFIAGNEADKDTVKFGVDQKLRFNTKDPETQANIYSTKKNADANYARATGGMLPFLDATNPEYHTWKGGLARRNYEREQTKARWDAEKSDWQQRIDAYNERVYRLADESKMHNQNMQSKRIDNKAQYDLNRMIESIRANANKDIATTQAGADKDVAATQAGADMYRTTMSPLTALMGGLGSTNNVYQASSRNRSSAYY